MRAIPFFVFREVNPGAFACPTRLAIWFPRSAGFAILPPIPAVASRLQCRFMILVAT